MLDLRQIIQELISFYNFKLENCKVVQYAKTLTSLEFLILSILSQNTNDELAERAFLNLVNKLGRPITAQKIIDTPRDVLVDCIRVSGMYNRKCDTIYELSRVLNEVGESVLDEMEVSSLKKLLLSIRGLGKKTVDVFLLFKRQVPTFPVDTHIKRICKRLGIVSVDDYDLISSKFTKVFGNDWRELACAHLVLIHHGRETCRALKPICDRCPLNIVCCFYKERSLCSYKRL